MTSLMLTIKELRKLFPENTITLDDQFTPTGVCHDSRIIKPGEIFVALRGVGNDGHEHIGAAFHGGASLAIAEKNPKGYDNILLCQDSLKGFQDLASYYRDKFSQPVIAITGSSGKTTTKDLVTHVLGIAGEVISTQGNLNNHIGVPLTIMRFTRRADFFVVEMGMNHLEEIRALARIARPTIGLITGVGHAHLEGVGGTLAGVAQAKGELFEELTDACWAVVNIDDPWIQKMSTRARKITIGMSVSADVRASEIQHTPNGSAFLLNYTNQQYPVQLRVTGDHHVRNALATFAIGIIVGVPLDKMIQSLACYTLEGNRGSIINWQGHAWIDDSYNANPDSMRASMETLVLRRTDQRCIAVLGGMNELGTNSAELHREVGSIAQQLGLKDLFALGPMAKEYVKGFAATTGQYASAFESHQELARALKQHLDKINEPAAILVKGSRGFQMEKIFSELGIRKTEGH